MQKNNKEMAEDWAVALVGLPSESPTAWGIVKRRSGELVSKNFSVSKPSLIVVIPPTGLRAGEVSDLSGRKGGMGHICSRVRVMR